MQTDREVVRHAARGNADAFRRLVADHQRLVAHVVFRMIPDPRDREDLCQDVFIRVYQKLRTFRFESKLSTWIARVAYRVCLNHLAKKRVATIELTDMQDVDAGPTATLDPADAAMAHEMHAFVRERVQVLPLPYRTVVTLHYLEDLSVQEIGEVMEIPAGTVKSHLFRARAILRRQLLTRYGEEQRA